MQRFSNPVCQTCPHRKGPLLGCCSLEELDFIADHKSVQYYQRGQTIYQQGNAALGLYCVREGKVKVAKAGSDDKEHIVQLLKQGDVLGYRAMLAEGRYTSSAIALEDSVVCFVPRPDFLRLLKSNSQFATVMMQMLAHKLGQAEESMLHLSYKPVRERLAGALLLVQKTFHLEGEELPFRIALSRDDWAALVGTAKETVSRLLSEFKEEGLIATRGSQITILKPARLLQITSLYK
jgi:CRP-like cAMP-binding protein